MSKNTERQRKIFEFLMKQPEQTAKRSDIVSEFEHWYYNNGAHHIDGLLYRMWTRGKVRKPKSGYYQAVTMNPAKPGAPTDENQTSLFG